MTPTTKQLPNKKTKVYQKGLFKILLMMVTSATADASPFHITLDPGHGGSDKGAVYGPIQEADLVLQVSLKLKKLLEQKSDIKISMTRMDDQHITLADRVKFAENAKADVFVSLHANAASDPRAKGVEFFFQNNLPPDEESLYLASLEDRSIGAYTSSLLKPILGPELEVDSSANSRRKNSISDNAIEDTAENGNLSKKGDVNAILEDLRRQNRMMSSLDLTQTLTKVWAVDPHAAVATIKQAPFYVISNNSMPAILIEVGFLTNPIEASHLGNEKYLDDVAKKIYKALLSYKEKMDKPELKTLN